MVTHPDGVESCGFGGASHRQVFGERDFPFDLGELDTDLHVAAFPGVLWAGLVNASTSLGWVDAGMGRGPLG